MAKKYNTDKNKILSIIKNLYLFLRLKWRQIVDSIYYIPRNWHLLKYTAPINLHAGAKLLSMARINSAVVRFKIVRWCSKNSIANLYLGQCYMCKGNYTRAIKYFAQISYRKKCYALRVAKKLDVIKFVSNLTHDEIAHIFKKREQVAIRKNKKTKSKSKKLIA